MASVCSIPLLSPYFLPVVYKSLDIKLEEKEQPERKQRTQGLLRLYIPSPIDHLDEITFGREDHALLRDAMRRDRQSNMAHCVTNPMQE